MPIHAKQNAVNAKQATKVRWGCAFPHVRKMIASVTVMRAVLALSVLEVVQRNVEEMDPAMVSVRVA